jgi:hypothetical protein
MQMSTSNTKDMSEPATDTFASRRLQRAINDRDSTLRQKLLTLAHLAVCGSILPRCLPHPYSD